MPSRLAPFLCSLVFGALVMSVAPATGLAASAPVACAGATTTTTATGSAPATTTINPGEPPPADASDGACWTDIEPYPFGAEGEAVNSTNCPFVPESIEAATCYLTVTSMAFRAWNRGVAATTEKSSGASQNKGANPYGVWLFNGDHWYPSPGFPGSKVCPGHTVVWAGKLDYWLVGGSPGEHDEWAHLCRFDGESLEWEPLAIPAATKQHLLEKVEIENGQEVLKLRPGTITSAACFAWNNCWFFGTYGTVIHWDGEGPCGRLPGSRRRAGFKGNTPARWRAKVCSANRWVWRWAPRAKAERRSTIRWRAWKGPRRRSCTAPAEAPSRPLRSRRPPRRCRGAAIPTGPTSSESTSTPPARAGRRATPRGCALTNRQPNLGEPSRRRGPANACPRRWCRCRPLDRRPSASGPPPGRFNYTPPSAAAAAAEVFLWSSIAVIPNGEASGEALAGGRGRQAKAGSSQLEVEQSGEPVVARADCSGTTTVTRFLAGSQPPADQEPADHEGAVRAIAANAANDAWAATERGRSGDRFS